MLINLIAFSLFEIFVTSAEATNNSERTECVPSQIYIENNITCVCKSDGSWSNLKCKEAFGSSREAKIKCNFDGYVIIDCNVCRCDSKGQIDYKYCTKNVCNEKSPNIFQSSRKFQETVHGKCQEAQWYSFGPCQFCYCLKPNKLVCNNKNDQNNHVTIGTHQLTACSSNLLNAIQTLANPTITDATSQDKTVFNAAKANNKQEHAIRTGNQMIPNNFIEVFSDTNDEDTEGNDEEIDNEEGKLKLVLTTKESASEEVRKDSADDSTTQVDRALEVDSVDSTADNMSDKKLEENSKEKVSKPKITLKMLQQFIHSVGRKNLTPLKSIPNSSCVPGTETKQGCKRCFCMKNGLLLCTDKKCD